jgi:Glycosyl hydrolase family 26
LFGRALAGRLGPVQRGWGLLGTVVVAIWLALGCASADAAIAPPPPGTTWLGVATPSVPSGVTQFAKDAGHAVGMVEYFRDWTVPFDTATANAVRALGATPVVTWEPWSSSNGTVNQPLYSLSRIIAGAYDSYIRTWATAAAAWGHPLFVRFAHEMNGNWYPWSEGVNGNRTGDFVRAWRHVHDVVVAAGARNVSWIWSVDRDYTGSTRLAGLYPGDAYVDWDGVDVYNGGTAVAMGGWLTFSQMFDPTFAEIHTFSTKPLLINEMASAEAGGSKSAWITAFFAALHADPAIRGFFWFNFLKETDWRIESSAAARTAFAAGVTGLTLAPPVL